MAVDFNVSEDDPRIRRRAANSSPEQFHKVTLFLFVGLLAYIVWATGLAAATYFFENLNSDTLYFPAMQKDLASGRYPLTGWWTSPAPYWFPDGVVYAVAAVVTPNSGAALVLSTILNWLLMLAAFAWLGREIWDEWLRPALLVISAGALFTLLCTSSGWSHQASLLWHVTFPGLHGGAISAGAATAAAAVRVLQGRGRVFCPITASAVSAAMFVSDQLYYAQFWLPVLLAAGLLALLGRVPARRVRVLLIACVVGLILGFALDRAFVGWLYVRPAIPDRSLALAQQGALFISLLGDVYEYLTRVPMLLIPIATTLFAVGELAFLRYLKAVDFRRQFLSVLVVLAVLATLVGPAVMGLWYGIPTIRYLLPLFVMPVLFIAIGILPRWNTPARAIAGIILCVCVLASVGSSGQLPSLEMPYPEQVRCVDEFSRELNLNSGLSGYWPAKRISLLSRRNLQVNQLTTNLHLFLLSNNLWWFRGPKTDKGYAYPRYDFILVNDIDATAVLVDFGHPAAHRECGTYVVWVYNRPQDVRFRNFLRSEAVAVTEGVAALASHEPVEVVQEGGNRVRARFRGPVNAAVAELSRPAPVDLDLTFLRDGQPVGTVMVARESQYAEIPAGPAAVDAVLATPHSSELFTLSGLRLF